MWKPKMTQDQKKDKKEEQTKEQKTEKKTPRAKIVVKEHHLIEGSKYYVPWETGIQEERKHNREGKRDLMGDTLEMLKFFLEPRREDTRRNTAGQQGVCVTGETQTDVKTKNETI